MAALQTTEELLQHVIGALSVDGDDALRRTLFDRIRKELLTFSVPSSLRPLRPPGSMMRIFSRRSSTKPASLSQFFDSLAEGRVLCNIPHLEREFGKKPATDPVFVRQKWLQS